MGTWGVGPYSNDTAADLRDEFKGVIRAPWDGDKLHAWALANYPSAADTNDDEFSDLRLVLADLFWTYGIEHPPTIESAQRIIADGTDLAAKRALGMGERDLRKRANVLDGLADKLRTDNPKPRARRILTKPERFVLEVGDCLLYPTSQGHIRNPYVGPRMEERFVAAHRWDADGWGAALVLMRYYRYGVFARYVIAFSGTILRPSPGSRTLRSSPSGTASGSAGARPSWNVGSTPSRRAVNTSSGCGSRSSGAWWSIARE
jgi:hypothetical protein